MSNTYKKYQGKGIRRVKESRGVKGRGKWEVKRGEGARGVQGSEIGQNWVKGDKGE